MEADDRILDVVLAAIEAGTTDFLDLVDHCLVSSELGELAELAGQDPAEYLAWLLENTDAVRVTDDDLVIRMDLLLDGVIFTHRLTEAEITSDAVTAVPDLSAIDLDVDALEVAGGVVRFGFDFGDDPHLSEHGSLVGPAGWLAGFAPDEIVAFRRQGRRLVVEPIEELGGGEEEVEALRQAFDDDLHGLEHLGTEPELVLEQVMIEDPRLFRRPVPPVSDLLAAAGIEMAGAWAGRSDVAWKPPMVARLDDLRDRLRSQYQLNECCEEALDLVIEAWTAKLGDEVPDTRSVNRALGHGPVIDAFSEWADQLFGLDSLLLGELATDLASSGGRDQAPALMLLARHHEASGDAPAAERDLEAAVRADPEYGPALAELAWYVSDRGDAARTVSLLRRAGVGDDDPMLAFHAGLGRPFPAVGRNQPCPCGSGRKYKVCHLGRTEVAAGERVNWLISKLTTFVTRPDRLSRLYGLAASATPPDFEVEQLAAAVQDEFLLELRVFEGGGVSEYLDARGALLPDDERDVLELWEACHLALWEVVSTDDDTSLVVRDTKTGDTLEVSDRSLAAGFRPGDQLLARFLPGWDHDWPSGVALSIDLRHRDSLLALLDQYPDADLIAQWYGSLHAPPSFANREGEPLVQCEARLGLTAGWADVTEVLDRHYEPAGGTTGTWHELFELHPGERILRATLRREGEELVVTTNSEARLARVLATVGDVTEVVAQTSEPSSSPAELAEALSQLPPEQHEEPDFLDEEVRDEIAHMMEQRWLDEEVPALGGITPRQAAADPTRREDLIALIRSFDRDAAGTAITMRPEVLRRNLDLPD